MLSIQKPFNAPKSPCEATDQTTYSLAQFPLFSNHTLYNDGITFHSSIVSSGKKS